MKQKAKNTGRKKGVSVIILVLVIIGIIGGVIIKGVFFGSNNQGKRMSNQEAIRLISYLGLADYEYPDKLGSNFTYAQARKLFEAADVPIEKSQISLKGVPGFMSMTKAQFEMVYGSLVEELALDRLYVGDLYIYKIDNQNDVDIDGTMYEVIGTSSGDFFMEKKYGMDSSLVGKVVKVYISNNEIVLCLGESKEEVTIKNVYVAGNSQDENGDSLLCYVNGQMQKFPYDSKNVISEQKNYLADVNMSNKGVTAIVDHTKDLVDVKVTSCQDGVITLDGYDEPVYLSDVFNVYKVNGTFKAMKSVGTLIGYDKVSMYMVDGMVEAALLNEDIYAKNIRVILNNSEYNSYYHNNVIVTSEQPFTVSYGTTVDEHEAGDSIEFRNGSKEFANGNIKIASKEEDGKIKVTSIKRQCGSPAYRGTLELSKDDQGVMIVNELPVEQYLYGVVPSEMPVSYEKEALKAQAICARAYAYRQMESDKYTSYGAHLDDSVSSQVYNNVWEDEKAIFAVDDTYGVVPCYNDEVIEAFFFSTSCGTTSNNSVVWGGNPEAYLLDTLETEVEDFANYDTEENFRSFIDGKLGTGFIEENEPFFRWNVTFTKEQLTQAINNHLYDRIEAMSENILVKNARGDFEKKAIQSIGDLVNVEVTKRGSSGIILEMVITGSSETILVKGQANARALLCPEEVSIYKQDGTSISGWTSLPSAYYYVEINGDEYVLKGGGFGHGVGMSQNGANDMAKLGYTASDIISHYYSSVDLKDMYEMMGR